MTTATETKQRTYHPGDWIEVTKPDPDNAELKGRYFEVVKATTTRLTVYKNPARYDWERIEDEPTRPIYNLGLAEVSPYRVNQAPSPAFCWAFGEMVMDDLNTENTNLPSLRRYGIFAGYRDFPSMGRDYPPQPWIKWEDGTEGFTSEHTLSTSPRPVYLREAPPEPEQPTAIATAPTVTTEIVTAEPIARLAELEAAITEGLGLIEQGKAKIWSAVAAVRSEELWRVAGHPSFEAYCADRWNWKKANGHENALAGEVLEELLLSGVPVDAVPTSTSAMSQLAKAPAGDRAEVLQKAADLNGGKVTEAAVREALKPEPTPEDELRSAGIPVYRPDTSPEAIAEGLERGYIVPTTAPNTERHQSGMEDPAPAVEPSEGLIKVGTRGTLKDCPHSFVVAEIVGNRLQLWNATERRAVHESEFTPYLNRQQPCELNAIARSWLRDIVAAMGPEQVQALLEEVA
ncbi:MULTISPECIES: hypothetical protein [Cyanophyceae]|uniref:hypothetical protein n=1 Tax=Cyanophyceae TaxID=3028117 RepID=UPI001687CDCE|nr:MULTISPECIES: hypothetical protein [Cyanophyceae]MBD1918909.1 hypothetical protein [Phormidium sp. FACHB-77]MBD2033249.1 hypothetical protein [Phormidium sp. FACHB-322]MBD2053818.1 hypothetical protein [Leptolyngbya sp. FACHB-60]